MADDGSTADDASRRDGFPGGGSSAGSLRHWLLLDGDRRVVVAVATAGFFLAMVALGAVDPSPLAATMTRSDPVETLFQAYVAAIVTGVTLVLTINQVVLSQELGAVGDQRDRMDGAMQFRHEAEAALDRGAAPADPAAFVRALLAAAMRRAEAIEAAVDDSPDTDGETFRKDVAALVGAVTASATATRSRLVGARFGTFAVVSATLDFDYSALLHEARRLRAAAGEGDAADALDDLVGVLELYGVTREHLKTLYFQWALIDLSRALLAVSLPALVVASAALLYLDPRAVGGRTLGASNVVWLVSATSTVAVVPFVTLLSYILRIATVAKRTLAIGPFVLEGGGGG